MQVAFHQEHGGKLACLPWWLQLEMKVSHAPEIKVGGTQGAPHLEQAHYSLEGSGYWHCPRVARNPWDPRQNCRLERVVFCAAMGLLPTCLSWRLLYSPPHMINSEEWQITCFSQARTWSIHCYRSQWLSEPQGKLWDQMQVHCSSLQPSLPFFLTSLSGSLFTFLLATFNANLLSRQTLHTNASSPRLSQEVCRLVWRLTCGHSTTAWLYCCHCVRLWVWRKQKARGHCTSQVRGKVFNNLRSVKPGGGRTQALSHWIQVSGLLTHSSASWGFSDLISDGRLCPWHNTIVKGLIQGLTQHSNNG